MGGASRPRPSRRLARHPAPFGSPMLPSRGEGSSIRGAIIDRRSGKARPARRSIPRSFLTDLLLTLSNPEEPARQFGDPAGIVDPRHDPGPWSEGQEA